MIHIGILSLFPDVIQCLKHGVTGRAIDEGLIHFHCWNLREWGLGRSKQVDDKPYGGGPGMVLMYEPLQAALLHARQQMPSTAKTIYLSPQGRKITQQDLNQIVKDDQSLLFLAGRYEGVDERIIDHFVDEEWSLGDYVLSGGELAAMVFTDAIVRLIPGSLGDEHSALQDSFMNGILDYPHYTRPSVINDARVPDVLLGGNHRDIERWRRKEALGKTWLKRPDLLEKKELTDEDKHLLVEFKHQE